MNKTASKNLLFLTILFGILVLLVAFFFFPLSSTGLFSMGWEKDIQKAQLLTASSDLGVNYSPQLLFVDDEEYLEVNSDSTINLFFKTPLIEQSFDKAVFSLNLFYEKEVVDPISNIENENEEELIQEDLNTVDGDENLVEENIDEKILDESNSDSSNLDIVPIIEVIIIDKNNSTSPAQCDLVEVPSFESELNCSLSGVLSSEFNVQLNISNLKNGVIKINSAELELEFTPAPVQSESSDENTNTDLNVNADVNLGIDTNLVSDLDLNDDLNTDFVDDNNDDDVDLNVDIDVDTNTNLIPDLDLNVDLNVDIGVDTNTNVDLNVDLPDENIPLEVEVCDDNNPCTIDECLPIGNTHINVLDGTSCGKKLACFSGICVDEKLKKSAFEEKLLAILAKSKYSEKIRIENIDENNLKKKFLLSFDSKKQKKGDESKIGQILFEGISDENTLNNIQVGEMNDYVNGGKIYTDVVAAKVEGDANAQIILPTSGKVNTILRCSDWNFENFSCASSWEATKIPFTQNDENIYFEVNSFSAYVGADLTILNLYSYPALYNNWEVRFTTTGTAPLTIKAVEGTNWSNSNNNYDLRFISIKCGGVEMPYEWSNNSVVINNYSCATESVVSSKELTRGKHVLEFTYGDVTKKAYNS
ncbi:MAG: hypothetical protein PHD05_09385, partial [Sphaerochaetaceae bacterium]|nr:hypothetical protein [Sphaerochaetaceae bacterium]